MNYAHVFHSMCYLNENKIYVTGSRETADGADTSVESYDISSDTWTVRPALPEGRCRHSSCGFQQRYVFVFCGWVNKARSNQILRLDTYNMDNGWEALGYIPSSEEAFEHRVCPGVL